MTMALLLTGILAYGFARKTDLFSAMLDGAKEGLSVLFRIVPALVALLAVIAMLRASGAMDAAADLLRPVFDLVGIPPECAPLIIIRPLSGSGALAVGAEIIAAYGPDSLIGRTAAVMLGSTETTFYCVGVICGAAGISKTRYIIPAALCADAVGFWAASWAVKLLMP
ncbi:MAG: spore maturation protein [Oscillospiraceae bacterium]|nr:spore maturation protein [Oscillospiraceae bacterium]